MSDKIKQDLAIQDDYITVFLTPQGKRVLEHLFKQLDMHTTTFVANDPYHSAWKEGRRSVLMEILRTINMDFTPLMNQAMKYQQRS